MMFVFIMGSCSFYEKDNILEKEVCKQWVFTAESGEEDTKTAFQADETSIWWSPNDAISIFYGASDGSKFTSTNTVEVAKAEFRGTLNAFTGESEAGVAYSFWAMYPYESALSCDGNTVEGMLSGCQIAKAGSFAPNTNISLAKSSGLNLSFYNVCSWFRFSVAKEGVRKITFKGNNNENIAGKFRVSFGDDGHPTAPDVVEGVKEIVLESPGNETFEVGKVYYITLFPQVFEEGFTVMFETKTEIGSRSINTRSTYLRSRYNSGIDFDKNVNYSKKDMTNLEVIDLGLSVLWASCNLGAMKPEEYGSYFAWGETESDKTNYTWASYKWTEGSSSTPLKYNTSDGKSELDPEDDAARLFLGEHWRMPTKEELHELSTGCTWTLKTQNGVVGYEGKSKTTGNTIFFPMSGVFRGTSVSEIGKTGIYWSSDLVTSQKTKAESLYMMSDKTPQGGQDERRYGYSIRPVYIKEVLSPNPPLPEIIDMGLSVGWASINVGAETPETMGDVFAWGEVNTKTDYEESTYKWTERVNGLMKYYKYNSIVENGYNKYVDNDLFLDGEDDAAQAYYGDQWRTPSRREWIELSNNCNWTWTLQKGMYGYIVESNITHNRLFLPVEGDIADYWTDEKPSNKSSSAYCYQLAESERKTELGYRYLPKYIRPVYSEKMPEDILVGIFLNTNNISLYVSLSKKLFPSTNPNSVDCVFKWSSADTNIATVDENGMVTGLNPGTTTITVSSVDNKFTDSCEVVVLPFEDAFVDLGLSVRWCKFNLGAESESAVGDYIAWGELEPKEEYSWDTYTYPRIEYNKKDGWFILKQGYDAATQKYGRKVRMPTYAEFQELVAKCIASLTDTGIKFYNYGNYIILPFSGYYSGKEKNKVNDCYYWTSCSTKLTTDLEDTKLAFVYHGYELSHTLEYRFTTRYKMEGLPVRFVYDPSMEE